MDIAIEQGQTEIVELLLSKGADPNRRTWKGQTPLHVAAYFSKPQIIKILVNHGARLDIAMPLVEEKTESLDGFYPIHLACISEYGHDVLRLLTELGADLNQKRLGYGQSPLEIAIRYGPVEAIQRLIALVSQSRQHALEVNMNRIRQAAIESSDPKRMQIIEMWLAAKSDQRPN
ncbi:putative ankyrin [Magnetofaba australis IT-1]|uniref:Putative ankyrin n=2 Tax=Magnetofaba TaxID=1472292 RepID=A0A1Y2K1I4_9PROT|nr:putative ankyrin [Magnetofaba australis IT-1]